MSKTRAPQNSYMDSGGYHIPVTDIHSDEAVYENPDVFVKQEKTYKPNPRGPDTCGPAISSTLPPTVEYLELVEDQKSSLTRGNLVCVAAVLVIIVLTVAVIVLLSLVLGKGKYKFDY